MNSDKNETTTTEYHVFAPDKTNPDIKLLLCYDNTDKNPDIWWSLYHNNGPYYCINPPLDYIKRFINPNDIMSQCARYHQLVDLTKAEIYEIKTVTTTTVTKTLLGD